MKINRKNNFDLLRLTLAILIMISHSAGLSENDLMLDIGNLINAKVAVDAFFIISGFLIFMSFENSSSIWSYTKKRAKRILPGYIAVIVICAVALSVVSVLKFAEYFTNKEFFQYIFFNLTTFNFLQPTLPGVFVDQRVQAINNPLWTIKVEIMFYIAVPIIGYIFSKINKVAAIAAIYLLSILYSTAIMQLGDRLDPSFLIQLEQQLPGQMAFFISGTLLYYFYEKFHNNSFIFLAISVLILVIHNFAFEIYFLYPLAFAVTVIYFCLIVKYLGNFGKYGDFSYGIYIWHFPILQVFVHYQLFDRALIGIPLSYLCVFIAAYLSWNYIEKPFLNKRSHYVVAETKEKDFATK